MINVLIKSWDEDEVVDVIACESQFKAEKVEKGISINLNHDMYYTQIEGAS